MIGETTGNSIGSVPAKLSHPIPIVLQEVCDSELSQINKQEVFQIFQKHHLSFGDKFMARVGKDFFIVIKSPKDMEIILSNVKYIDKSHEYTFLEGWLGTGLLTSTGKKWSARRKLITPTFHFNILKQFVETFDEHADTLMRNLKIVADGQELDIHPIIAAYTLDVICETAMGVNLNSQNDTNIPYVQAIKVSTELFMKRFFSIIGRYNLTYKLFSSNYAVQKRAVEKMHEFTNGVIKQRRELLDWDSSTAPELGTTRKLAFLDMLLQSTENGEPLSDEGVREEVDTFMFESQDTTTVVITFAIMLLSKNTVVQQKLYDELVGLIDGGADAQLTYDDLNKMKYLENVIKETMRLYPAVPMIGRQAKEDIELTSK